MTGQYFKRKSDGSKEVGGYCDRWDMEDFEPCEAPQGTTKPAPANDVDLRLECLKLASKARKGQSKESIMQLAQEYCDWVLNKIEVVSKMG